MKIRMMRNRWVGLALPLVVALVLVGVAFLVWYISNSVKTFAIAGIAVMIAGLGVMIVYYWLWHVHDTFGQPGWLYAVLVYPGAVIMFAFMLSGFHDGIAKSIGPTFAPDYRETTYKVSEEKCIDYRDRLTKCSGFTTNWKTKFYSSNPKWESALNNWLIMVGPVSAVGPIFLFFAIRATIVIKHVTKPRSGEKKLAYKHRAGLCAYLSFDFRPRRTNRTTTH